MKNIILFLTLAAMVLQVKALDVTTTAGSLSSKVNNTGVTELKVAGTMDATDFYFITDNLKQLRSLDLTGVQVVGCDYICQRYWQEGFKADELPMGGLSGLNVTSVRLPSSLRSIGKGAFVGCLALEEVMLPATLDSIGEYAFAGCAALHEVMLPASVRVVDTGAFMGCTSLTSFKVEPNNRLKRLNATALLNCPSLTTLDLGSSIRTIGERALLGIGIQHLDLTANSSLESIGDWAVAMSPVAQVSLPSGVTSVGDGAFFYDKNLATIDLGGKIEDINDYLLACTALEGNIDLTGVSRIGDYAFYNVSTLPVVELPATVTWLGAYAMAGMTGLTALTSNAVEVPALGEHVWAGVKQRKIPLTVPADSKSLYQEADQWKEFMFGASWLRGDVNNDGEVNIADVNTLIDIILGGRFDDQTMLRADVNEDGEIGIADINAVIDIILNPGSYAPVVIDTEDALHLNEVSLRPGEQRTLQLTLDNADNYSAVQCDIILPIGLSLLDVAASQGQATETRDLGDAWTRTIAYSMDKRRFDGEGKAVLTLTVRADEALAGTSQITVSNIVLADDNNVGWHAADCVATVNNTSGIEDLTATADRLWIEGRTLCIDTRNAASAMVTAMNGAARTLTLVHGENRFDLEQGFYVVVLNGRSHKIAIR